MKQYAGVKEYGPQGPAEVEVRKDTLTITFLDTRGHPTDQEFTFKKDDLPEGADPPSGVYICSVSSDGQYLQGFKPASGAFNVRVVRFAAKPNEPPKPKHDVGTGRRRDGTTYPKDQMTFGVIAEIVDHPDFEHLEVYLPFIYQRRGNGFIEDLENEGILAIRGEGETMNRLRAFLEVTGAWDKPIGWSDNVLPELEKAILKADRTFLIVLKDGWPQSYSEVPQYTARKKTPAKKKAASPRRKASTSKRKK